MRGKAYALASAMMAAALVGGFAQAGPVTVDLGDALVLGDLKAPSELSPTAMTVVLEAVDIATSGAENLAELVEAIAGVESRSYGSPGSARTASVRGGAGGHVVVVLDGVRLSDARTGWVDLSTIPLFGIERVEIMRSGASALYGSDAIAGVIYLSSARSGTPAIRVRADYSAYPLAFGAGEAGLAAAQGLSAFGRGNLGGATLTASGGIERAADSTVAADADEGYALITNAGLLTAWADAGLTAAIGNGVGALDLFGRYADKGVPGSQSYPSPEAAQTEYEARAMASWNRDDAFDGTTELEFRAGAAWSRMNYVDPDYSTDDTHDSAGMSLGAAARAAIGPALVMAGAEGAFDSASSTKIGDRTRLSTGAYLVPEIELGSFTFAPSARFDLYDDVEAGLSYGLGLAWSGNGLSFKLNGASAYKAPSFSDLYWPDDGFTAGNAELGPERAYSGELGLEYAIKFGSVALSLAAGPYLRYVDDMIAWVDADGWTGPEPYKPENIDVAGFAGADVELKAGIGPFTAKVSYSYSLAKDLGDGATFLDASRLAYSPLHSAGAVVRIEAGALSVGADASYRAGRLDSSGAEMGDALLLGITAGLEVGGGLAFAVDVDNLLNVEYYEYADYPMPGLRVTLSATFTK